MIPGIIWICKNVTILRNFSNSELITDVDRYFALRYWKLKKYFNISLKSSEKIILVFQDDCDLHTSIDGPSSNLLIQ